jgi:ABC-type cobalamin/Fe3+-siderophores transport system ATPase subunit
MSDPTISIHSLLVRRGRQNLLEVDRFDMERGEVVVVLGPNGAGKSTLLKCLLGFIRPASGTIRVLGTEVVVGKPLSILDCFSRQSPPSPSNSLRALRRRIGYVPQAVATHGEMPLTVREVVAVGRTGIAGLGCRLRRDDWEQCDRWLDRLGMADLAGRAFADLSGGEQRKTLIAKAMVQEPEILLLDEPTAHLDLFWRERIVETLEQLHETAGLTILLVCHELEAIPPCAGRLLVLRQGRMIADGLPKDVLTVDMIASLHGPKLKLMSGGGRYAVVPTGENAEDAK